jgi:hypothetical protein
MGQGRLCQSLSSQVLLFALAIQAVTPDPDDLVSANALRLICPFLSGSESLLHEDQMPDDVCEPQASDMQCLLRHQAQGSDRPSLRLAAAALDPGAAPGAALRSGSRATPAGPARSVLPKLCRLRC